MRCLKGGVCWRGLEVQECEWPDSAGGARSAEFAGHLFTLTLF